MNIKVYYHSSTGNTKKLADAIADTLNVPAKPITQNMKAITKPVDLLLLGDGIYFSRPHKDTAAFIKSLNPQKIKNAAVFATYGGQSKIGADIRKLLTERGINVLESPFASKGRAWMLINRRHPDETDVENARSYARWALSRVTPR